MNPFYESAAMVDRSDRGKLRFTGEQNLWFLDQLLTNKLDDLAEQIGAEALLLTPKGRISDHLRLVRNGDAVYADVEPGRSDELLEFFQQRVFITKAEISDVTQGFGLLEVFGPATDTALGSAGISVPTEIPYAAISQDDLIVLRIIRPLPGVAIWVPRESLEQTQASLLNAGVAHGKTDDLHAVMVVEGSPRLGIDFGDSHLPQEAALEYLVHFAKGCYLGQEAVAMAQRGQVKKRLRHLHFEQEALTGRVLYGNEEAGTVTSAAEIAGLSRGVATLKTSVPTGARVTVVSDERQSDAVVKALPGTIDGPKLPSARELRERLQGSKT
ncbi:MAG: hypothetical protein KY429_03420 [Actinobacteria bacterium]|nr:hypothetical protein [Actinomycetota bacterium]